MLPLNRKHSIDCANSANSANSANCANSANQLTIS